MSVLRSIIDRHEKLKLMDVCLRNIGNDSFRAKVFNKDSSQLQLELNSEGCEKGILYQIQIGHKGDGFFAEYRRMLNYLYYADQLQLIPYIVCTQDYTYAEAHPVNGHSNPFEYYFCQPCVSGGGCDQYRYIVRNRDCDLDLSRALKPENGYDLSEEYVAAMADITRRYIRPNKETKELQQQGDELLGNEKTLGIHVRLTDFRKNFYGHPTCVPAEQHIKLARSAMKEYGFQRIFLATDDVDTVKLFKKEFGEKLLTYSDVTRSDGEVSVAFSEAGRMNHHYLLGQEVLRDMYTLAKCDGLIAGKSQVSICAYIQKRTTGDYCYREILDAGYNTDSSRKFSDELQRLQQR